MDMTWPAIASWILILLATVLPSPLPLMYLMLAFGAFQSLTLFPGFVGDAITLNLLPQSVCAVFLVLKMLLPPRPLACAIDAAIDPAKLSVLFIFLALALFSAYVMPRFFSRMVEVIPMNPQVKWPVVLGPTSANISQPAYVLLSVGVVLAFAVYGRGESFRRHYLGAILLAYLVLIGTGLADLVLSAAGLDDLLQPFRNAKYALLVDVNLAGLKRVVGLMPEASAFGPACVAAAAVLAFLRPCYESAFFRNRLAPLIVAGLLGMGVLSASSTAFGGIAVFGIVFAANWVRRVMTPDAPARDGLKWEATAAIAGMLILLAILVLVPDLLDQISKEIDQLIFKKSETASYDDRALWTKSALHAFFATHGLGVGLGSARTSSWFVTVLTNTGVLPTLLLAGFGWRLYFKRCHSPDPQTNEFVTALRFALVPWFAMAAVSWPSVDVGAGIASILGLIAALTSADAKSSVRSEFIGARQILARGHPWSA
jgi:hypothetical protein